MECAGQSALKQPQILHVGTQSKSKRSNLQPPEKGDDPPKWASETKGINLNPTHELRVFEKTVFKSSECRNTQPGASAKGMKSADCMLEMMTKSSPSLNPGTRSCHLGPEGSRRQLVGASCPLPADHPLEVAQVANWHFQYLGANQHPLLLRTVVADVVDWFSFTFTFGFGFSFS